MMHGRKNIKLKKKCHGRFDDDNSCTVRAVVLYHDVH